MADQGSGIPFPPPPQGQPIPLSPQGQPISPPPMPQAPVHPSPAQMEVPSFRAPDVQLLVQDLAQSRRDLFEERRNSSNRLAEERERSRWEMERVRTEFGAQIKGLEREVEALVRAVGRTQAENDHLREQNAILRQKPTEAAPAPAAEKQPEGKIADITALPRGPQPLQFMPMQNPLGTKPAAIPPQVIAVPVMPSGQQILPRNV